MIATGTTAFVSVWFPARWQASPDNASSRARHGAGRNLKVPIGADIRLRAEKAPLGMPLPFAVTETL